MTSLLVLRPEPGASATARAACALGLKAIAAPLFTIVPCHWPLANPNRFDALLLTSANAARHGGPGLAPLLAMPVFAVGAATAAAARAAGFADIRSGDGDGAALVALAAEQGFTRLLHLTADEHRPLDHPGVSIERRIVYRAAAAEALPAEAIDALAAGAVALLHSPRAARLFGDLVDAAGIDRSGVGVAAISASACAAAGPGWSAARAADVPTDAALLAVAARLCD